MSDALLLRKPWKISSRLLDLPLAISRQCLTLHPLTSVNQTYRRYFAQPNSIFSYERLNWAASEVRLIEILPQKGHRDHAEQKPVDCSIYHLSLDEHPKYLALSYAWGDTKRTELLHLNNKTLKITKSLDIALRQLRRMMENGDLPSNNRLWIDALSINQEDDIEKTWQVQQMGQIYRNADHTVVWLGSASDSSTKVMKELDRIGKTGEIGETRRASDKHSNSSTLDLFRTSSNIDVSIGASLIELFRRSWWARIWVVQEFAFAKEVQFVCGDTMVWSQRFFKALDLIKQYLVSVALESWKESVHESDHRRFMAEMSTIHNVLRLFHIRNKLNKEDKKFAMWEVLALKRSGMQASDDRDMVYALTGLSADAASKMLYPDYSRIVQNVYIQTAKAFLIERRLRLLWFCSHPRVLTDLPSWVPDWSATWRNDYRYLSEDGGYGQSSQIFWAAGDSRPVVCFSGRDTTMLLHMQGFEFDTVYDMRSAFDMSQISRAGFCQVQLAISDRGKALWDLKREHVAAKGDSYDDVIRTMTTDIELYWGLDGTPKHRRAGPELIRETHDTFLINDEEHLLKASRKLPASQLHLLYRHVARRPFITSRGHLGLGPADMLPGDRVVVLLGAELPLVLRQDNKGYYRIIGEAYVYGIMDGEVLNMGLLSKSFNIR